MWSTPRWSDDGTVDVPPGYIIRWSLPFDLVSFLFQLEHSGFLFNVLKLGGY